MKSIRRSWVHVSPLSLAVKSDNRDIQADPRCGFTIVELLVCIAVIGTLLALLMPAIQHSRSAARRMQCTNNLKQQGLAIHHHVDTWGFIPGGGWGLSWLGIAERGSGKGQPGGWMYCILPFCEQTAVYELAPRISNGTLDLSNLDRFVNTPVPILSCPERRDSRPRPAGSGILYFGSVTVSNCIRSDYVANGGVLFHESISGPTSLEDSDTGRFAWPNMSDCTGTCFLRSEIRLADVSDGTSQVIAVGEKWVPRNQPNVAQDYGGDNQPFVSGDSLDIRRWGQNPPARDDQEGGEEIMFGSAHMDGAGFLLCDGSVRVLPYYIDPYVFKKFSARNDGEVIELQ